MNASTELAFRWESASRSETGNVRKLNEDACLDWAARGLWVVADGMGGHEAGDVASRMLVDVLGRVRSPDAFSEFVDTVEDSVLDVNSRLYAQANEGEAPRVIGCTLALMMAYGTHCVSVWAGDSRVYRHRHGRLEQITRDHSEVEELIERGELSADEAESHPSKNVITRAVGGQPTLYLDFTVRPIERGDRFLICSDGLYKDLTPIEIEGLLGTGNCVEACDGLLETALERECIDNVTAIVVDFEERAA